MNTDSSKTPDGSQSSPARRPRGLFAGTFVPRPIVPRTLIAFLLCLWQLTAAAPAGATIPLETGVSPHNQTIAALAAFETKVGKKQKYFLFYANWDWDLPTDLPAQALQRGSIPIVTWEPIGMNLDGVLSPSKEEYIRRNARNLKALPGTVIVRPMHEMNGNWYSWGATKPGNTPAKFVTAWRRIVTLFREEGATNVRFLWGPSNNGPDPTGATPGKSPKWIPLYYPGDAYVDYAGLNAFNFGKAFTWSHWYVFTPKFKPTYAEVVKVSSKPIIITETSSVEAGGDKARWITEMYASTKKNYPRVKAVIWFDWFTQNTDYRVGTTARSLAAFKTQMQRLGSAPTALELDMTKPGGKFGWPLSRKKTFKRKGSIVIYVKAWDKVGVSRVKIYVDRKLKKTDRTVKYTYRWRLSRVRLGKHTVKAVIIDKAGNERVLTKNVTIKKR